jgi:peptidoglycan/xylan/chitin deacetylase (PgdA/CDA1 family)
VFRPPYGSRTRALDGIVRDERMLSILWNVDSADYTGAVPDQIRRNVVGALERGSVVLMHDGGGDELSTLAALPSILRAIKRRGYETVTLPRLFRLERER